MAGKAPGSEEESEQKIMDETKRYDKSTGEVLDCPCGRECTEDCSCSQAEECEKMPAGTLLDDMRAAMRRERDRAAFRFGRFNHSAHESYALVQEEYEEAEAALKKCKEYLKEMWKAVREDNFEAFAVYCRGLKTDALSLAEECIQLAAMADKGDDSVFQ